MGLISVQSRPSRCAGSFMNIISAKQRRGPDWTGPAQGSPRQSGVNRRLTTGRKRSENRESSAWRCWGGALPDWGSAFAFHIEPGVHDLPKVSHFPRCSAKLRAREAESAWELRPPHHRPDHVLHSPRARGQEHKSDGPPLAPQPLRQRAFAVPAVCRAELRSKDSQSPVVGAGGPQPGSFPGAGALTADMVPTSCSQAWGPQHSPHPHWLPLTWKRSRLRQAFSRWPFLRRVARPHRLPTQAFLSRKLCRELPAGPTRISVVMGARVPRNSPGVAGQQAATCPAGVSTRRPRPDLHPGGSVSRCSSGSVLRPQSLKGRPPVRRGFSCVPDAGKTDHAASDGEPGAYGITSFLAV
uniref:Uncharacterized protein n=1 Tax=Rangifer tarandus platyrhynchus TaxID=3082113 RepID=A0ACB0FFF0_RANTA|nr:unnamed protein product [Rangifer tarandus platyrhynchus]